MDKVKKSGFVHFGHHKYRKFEKITSGLTPTHINDDGIMIYNLFDFLLKEDGLDDL